MPQLSPLMWFIFPIFVMFIFFIMLGVLFSVFGSMLSDNGGNELIKSSMWLW